MEREYASRYPELGLTIWSLHAGGALSGKYTRGEKAEANTRYGGRYLEMLKSELPAIRAQGQRMRRTWAGGAPLLLSDPRQAEPGTSGGRHLLLSDPGAEEWRSGGAPPSAKRPRNVHLVGGLLCRGVVASSLFSVPGGKKRKQNCDDLLPATRPRPEGIPPGAPTSTRDQRDHWPLELRLGTLSVYPQGRLGVHPQGAGVSRIQMATMQAGGIPLWRLGAGPGPPSLQI